MGKRVTEFPCHTGSRDMGDLLDNFFYRTVGSFIMVKKGCVISIDAPVLRRHKQRFARFDQIDDKDKP